MVTMQKTFTNLVFSEILKDISYALQNLTFVQLSVDEIMGIKCGSEIAWYKTS